MPLYILERYLPAGDRGTAEEVGQLASSLLDRQGGDVRYLETMVLIDDQMAFVLLEAESVEALRHATERVGLGYERIVEACLHRSARERP